MSFARKLLTVRKLQEIYRRFRAWQKQPFNYSLRSYERVTCQNCGNKFLGNFCPVCGQKAGIGKIGWNSVRQGIMILWGLDNRSFTYTLIQLFLRPGYLISDYINGRRQVSFPPVKTLFFTALAVMLVSKAVEYLFPEVISPKEPARYDDNGTLYIAKFMEWADANLGWSSLISNAFFILPTWKLFRNSPQNTRHTLPQGFFIQVFLATQSLILQAISQLTGIWVPFFVMVLYIISTYKQLFGYRWWGTIWRTITNIIIGFSMVFLLSLFTYMITKIVT